MSATEKAIGLVKNVLLFNERLEGIGKEIAELRTDLGSLSRDLVDVDRRVTRIEGVMEGYARAGGSARRTRQKQLPDR